LRLMKRSNSMSRSSPLGNDVGPPSGIVESFSRLDVPSDIDTLKGNVLPSKVPGQLHQAGSYS